MLSETEQFQAALFEHRAEVHQWLRMHPEEQEAAALMYRSLELCAVALTALWEAVNSEMCLKYLVEHDPEQRTVN